MRRWPWPAFVRFILVFLAAWFLSLAVGHLPVPKLNGVPHLVPGSELGHPLPPGGSPWPLLWPEILATWGRMASAGGIALLPAAVLGILVGRRPGRWVDRLVQVPVALLSGLPSTVVIMLLVGALVVPHLATIGVAVQVGLGLWLSAWLTQVIRDGVAQAQEATGTRWPRALALALGRLCQRGGHLLVMAALADMVLIGPVPGHLGYVLRMAVGVGDTVVAAATLLFLAAMAGVLGLAGDILVHVAAPSTQPRPVTTDAAEPVYFPPDSDPYARASGPAETARPSRLHLGIGLLLSVLVLVACYLSLTNPQPSLVNTLLPPGTSGHLLGTDDMGRDIVAKVSAGTRTSLIIGLWSALVALLTGGAFGALGGVLGRWGAVVAPRVYAPALLPPLLLIAAATMLARPGPSDMAFTFGLGAIPVMAYPVRQLIVALRNRQPVQGPWLGVLGGVLLVVGQSMMAEIAWSLFGLGLVHPRVSLGTVINDGIEASRMGPHVLLYPILVVLFVGGLLLLGNALVDGSSRQVGE